MINIVNNTVTFNPVPYKDLSTSLATKRYLIKGQTTRGKGGEGRVLTMVGDTK